MVFVFGRDCVLVRGPEMGVDVGLGWSRSVEVAGFADRAPEFGHWGCVEERGRKAVCVVIGGKE